MLKNVTTDSSTAKANAMVLFTKAVCVLTILLWPFNALSQSVNAVPIASANPVVTPYNTPAVNAPVYVCLVTAFGTPCNTAGVILYSDYNVSNVINNPAKTNAQGTYSFFINSSQYPTPQLFLVQVYATPTGPPYTYYFSTFGGGGGSGSVTGQVINTIPLNTNGTATAINAASALTQMGSGTSSTVAAAGVVTAYGNTSIGSAPGDSATLGPELTNSGNVTVSGWTGSFPNYTNGASNTGAITVALTGLVIGDTYVFQIGSVGASAGSISATFEGADLGIGLSYCFLSSSTYWCSAKATATSGNLVITPTASYNGSTGSSPGISVQHDTPISNIPVTVKDSTGAVVAQVLGLGTIGQNFSMGGNTFGVPSSGVAQSPNYSNEYFGDATVGQASVLSAYTTCAGWRACQAGTNLIRIAAFGNEALTALIYGQNITAVGQGPGFSLVNAINDNFVGNDIMVGATGGSFDSIMGTAGFHNCINASCVDEAAIGEQIFYYNTTGSLNIGMGAFAGDGPFITGYVASVTGVSGGSGFSGSGTIFLTNFNNGGTGATATVTLASGVFSSAVITNAGSGFTSNPTSATCTSGTATCTGSPVSITVTTTTLTGYPDATTTGSQQIMIGTYASACTPVQIFDSIVIAQGNQAGTVGACATNSHELVVGDSAMTQGYFGSEGGAMTLHANGYDGYSVTLTQVGAPGTPSGAASGSGSVPASSSNFAYFFGSACGNVQGETSVLPGTTGAASPISAAATTAGGTGILWTFTQPVNTCPIPGSNNVIMMPCAGGSCGSGTPFNGFTHFYPVLATCVSGTCTYLQALPATSYSGCGGSGCNLLTSGNQTGIASLAGGLNIAGSQTITGVQGTTGTNLAVTTGSFTTGHVRTTDSNGNEIDGGAGPGSGTVTSIATTSPITGGTITSTGTIACATCVVATSPGAGIAHFAGSTQTVTSSPVSLTADVTGNLPNASLATQTANTVLGALTATTPSGLAMPSCSGATNALSWTSGTGFGCNTISGGVTSVSNSDSTLTITPTTGAVVGSLNLSHANTWAALQTFGTNISIGGVTAAGATGTGNVVFGTAPTIGLVNGTGLPLTSGVTGILPNANTNAVGGGTPIPTLASGTTVAGDIVTEANTTGQQNDSGTPLGAVPDFYRTSCINLFEFWTSTLNSFCNNAIDNGVMTTNTTAVYSSGGLTLTSSQHGILPTADTSAWKTISVYLNINPDICGTVVTGVSGNPAIIIGNGGGGGGYNLECNYQTAGFSDFPANATLFASNFGGSSKTASWVSVANGPTMVTTICANDGTAEAFYMNGVLMPSYITGPSNCTYTASGPLWIGNTNVVNWPLPTTYYAMKVDNAKLTAAQIAQDYQAVSTAACKAAGIGCNTPNPTNQVATWPSPSSGPQIIGLGDSHMTGVSGPSPVNHSWLFSVTLQGNAQSNGKASGYGFHELGQSGLELTNLMPLFPWNMVPFLKDQQGSVVIMDACTNDLVNSVTPQACVTLQAQVAAQVHALGGKYVSLSMLSRTGSGVQANVDIFNALWRVQCPTFADSCVDIAADPNLGGDTAYSNTTYFQTDGIHLNATGQALVAGYATTALNKLLFSLGPIATIPTTITPPQVSKLQITTVYTNATATPSTIWTFAVGPSTAYHIECDGQYKSASGGAFELTVTGPASPANVSYSFRPTVALSAGAPTDLVYSATGTSYPTGINATAITTAATDMPFRIIFDLVTGTSVGTPLNIQGNTISTDTLTVEVGATCTMQ